MTTEIHASVDIRAEARIGNTPESVRKALRYLIVNELVPLDENELDDDASLVDDILDSLGLAEVAVFIEEQIGRPLREDEETRATFATVNSVVDFILRNR